MKKIYYLFIALVSVLTLFVSCEQPKPDEPVDKPGQLDTLDTPDTPDIQPEEVIEQVSLVVACDAFYSKEFVEGVSNDYWMSLASEDIEVVEGEPYGTGHFVYLEVFPKTVADNFPAGEYTFAEKATDGYAWSGWEWDFGADMGFEEGLYLIPQGSFVYVMEDDELVAMKYIVGGKASVSGTSSNAVVKIDAIFDDGSKSNYTYEGKLEFKNYDAESGGGGTGSEDELNWDYEPTTVGEYEATFEYCDMNNWGDYYGNGVDVVDLTLSGVEWYAVFGFSAPLGSGTENVYGTYTVASSYDDYTEWTVVPSPGGDYYYDYASFLATDFDDSGAYGAAYYVTSGTVVVAPDGITMDVVSHYGSKIHGEYNGDVVIADKTTTEYAPVSRVKNYVEARKTQKPIKLVKASVVEKAYFGAIKSRIHK